MAFQFTKDKSNALILILSGDIYLEITPEIKSPNYTTHMFPERHGRRLQA